ncbi:histidine phosphatase family protein [Candidatus Woesearchaeota archaeon]|nr:histidine phosphatase family protein [Candidatus Woesearchaeota archaeon]
MLELYLIRHAESEMNVNAHLIGGRSHDTPLSEAGVMQAGLLGKRLQGLQFHEVYSSPAVRTKQTSEIVCSALGYPLEKIVYAEELHELSQGDWEGKPRSEIYTPETLVHINSNNWDFRPPNGDSQRDVEERMYRFIEKSFLVRSQGDLVIGVFTHGLAIKCFLRRVMDFTPKITYKIEIDNTSVTRLRYTEHGWHPVSINDAAHLRPY